MVTKYLKISIFYFTLFILIIFNILLSAEIDIFNGYDHNKIITFILVAFAVINWVFNTIPMSITALIVIVFIPFTGQMSFSDTIKYSFGDSIFAFFLGVLLLSVAVKETNLGNKIAYILFRIFGNTPKRLLFGLMLCGTIFAMWITEVAACAIIFPITLSIIEQTKNRQDHKNIGKIFSIGVAWGCAFGGVATPIATGANVIAIKYLYEYSNIDISFFKWMSIGIPSSILLLLAGWFLLSRGLKDNTPIKLDDTDKTFSSKEKALLIIFIIAIIGWIYGTKIGISSQHVALIVAVLMFIPKIEILNFSKAIKNISWDSIILICSGAVIGNILYTSGSAKTISDIFFIDNLLKSGIFISSVYIILIVSILKIILSSNTVAGIVLVPIMISLAATLKINAWYIVAPCILSSALSLIVISSSPVNIIPYSAGYFNQIDMFKYGIIMTILSAIIISLILLFLI